MALPTRSHARTPRQSSSVYATRAPSGLACTYGVAAEGLEWLGGNKINYLVFGFRFFFF